MEGREKGFFFGCIRFLELIQNEKGGKKRDARTYYSRMTRCLRAENITLLYSLIRVFQIPETSKPSTPRSTSSMIQSDSGISQRTKSTESWKKKTDKLTSEKVGENSGLQRP